MNAYAVALNDRYFRDYEYVLIGCSPNFNMATQIAMIASQRVLIPHDQTTCRVSGSLISKRHCVVSSKSTKIVAL